MELRLKRLYPKKNYTIGKLYINGVAYCDTLEDPVRDHNKDGDLDDPGEGKVWGDTAIPYGTYELVATWSPKFQRMLPLVKDVKHFEGIRIHAGNTTTDTSGCILPGENKAPGMVLNSRPYEMHITSAVMLGMQRGEQVKIIIT
jgi:hypothetical protein